MPRPFSSHSAEQLRTLFDGNMEDLRLVQEIADELGFRSTTTARRLRAAVDAQLAKLATVRRPQSRPPPAHPQPIARLDQATVEPRAESPVLCVDFGTSSLRGAWRTLPVATPDVLLLGEAVRSQIDAASVPSAIFMSAADGLACFGQHAMERGLRGEPSLLFETSPKRWLTQESLDDLVTHACAGFEATRRDLIAGLLAHGLSAACSAAMLPTDALAFMDVRIAHPVWRPAQRASASEHLRWILLAAKSAAGQTDQPRSAAELASVCALQDSSLAPPRIDVIEPTAAAVELFANATDARQLCAVVDVGAGTIDLALLFSLTPDIAAARARRRLIPLADPQSIYMAGDKIDEEVLALIEEGAPAPLSLVDRADLRRRRRALKEMLFRNKRLSQGGGTVLLSDLEQRPQIREMSRTLGERFVQLVQSAGERLRVFVDAQDHAINRVHVVFAGGGADIAFLRNALPQRVSIGGGRSLPVFIQKKASPHEQRQLPASLARLAVALGGTASEKGLF